MKNSSDDEILHKNFLLVKCALQVILSAQSPSPLPPLYPSLLLFIYGCFGWAAVYASPFLFSYLLYTADIVWSAVYDRQWTDGE